MTVKEMLFKYEDMLYWLQKVHTTADFDDIFESPRIAGQIKILRKIIPELEQIVNLESLTKPFTDAMNKKYSQEQPEWEERVYRIRKLITGEDICFLSQKTQEGWEYVAEIDSEESFFHKFIKMKRLKKEQK